MTLGIMYGFLCGDCDAIPLESVLGLLLDTAHPPVQRPHWTHEGEVANPSLCLTLAHSGNFTLNISLLSPRITSIVLGFLWTQHRTELGGPGADLCASRPPAHHAGPSFRVPGPSCAVPGRLGTRVGRAVRAGQPA